MYHCKFEYKEAFKTTRWYVCIIIIRDLSIFPSKSFSKKVPPRSPDFPSSHFSSCQDLLNEALNPKMCRNEKSIKLVFTYEKVILYYHNVLFNWKTALKKFNCLIKKTRKTFLSSDFRFEISAKNSFRKHLHPDAPFSKKNCYGMAALWVGCIRSINYDIFFQILSLEDTTVMHYV